MSAEVIVRVVPRSSRQRIEVQADRTLKVWLHAAPVEGEANKALVEMVAKALSVAPRQVEIVSGSSARTKRIRIEGIELPTLWERLS